MTIASATLGARNTRPGILVKLGDTRLSSRGTLTYGGFVWTSSSVALRGLGSDGTGRQTLRLTLDDTTNTWPDLIVAGLDAGLTCDLWTIYISPAAGTIEGQQSFSGVVRQASVGGWQEGQQVTIEAVSEGPNVAWTPRISWLSPFAVRRGTEVTINSETFRLE